MPEAQLQTSSATQWRSMVSALSPSPALGKQPPTDGARPRKILVKVGSKQQAMDILKAGRRSSELNKDRKVVGEPPIGVDRNLSGSELLHRNSIWPRQERGQGVPLADGLPPIVDGLEVLPDMTT